MISFLFLLIFCRTRAENNDQTKVYALHFPQFHQDALNDKLWGRKFTDWDNLNSSSQLNRYGAPILKPTKEIGYYDLMDYDIRKKQAEIAKKYGVDGFLYHHYWFYDGDTTKVLYRPLEQMLLDNEPDLPFAFHWAATRWIAVWLGMKGHTANPNKDLVLQKCPVKEENLIREHYEYLKKFFFHKNYIKVNGAPLFLANGFFPKLRIKCRQILKKFKQFAIDDGFPSPGIHLVYTHWHIGLHELYLKKTRFRDPIDGFDSLMYYPSHYIPPKQAKVPPRCIDKSLQHKNYHRPVYTSTFTLFDNTPRRNLSIAHIFNRTISHLDPIASFEYDMVEIMIYERCCQDYDVREKGGKFVAVNAWNEWAEGMVLEPSQTFGYQFLDSIQNAKEIVNRINCNMNQLLKYRKDLGF